MTQAATADPRTVTVLLALPIPFTNYVFGVLLNFLVPSSVFEIVLNVASVSPAASQPRI